MAKLGKKEPLARHPPDKRAEHFEYNYWWDAHCIEVDGVPIVVGTQGKDVTFLKYYRRPDHHIKVEARIFPPDGHSDTIPPIAGEDELKLYIDQCEYEEREGWALGSLATCDIDIVVEKPQKDGGVWFRALIREKKYRKTSE